MSQTLEVVYLKNLRNQIVPGMAAFSEAVRTHMPNIAGLHTLVRGMEEIVMPGRWEFLLIDATDWEFGEMHARLAELKSEGWELANPAQPRLGPGSGGGELKFVLRRRILPLAEAVDARSA